MDFKKQAAQKAVTFIKDNSVIGLGAGSTMAHMVNLLKAEAAIGFKVKVATSSFNTRQLLLQNGFAVLHTEDLTEIDLYFDGCDQFDKNLNALKSGGGVHTHEKLLASMAQQFIIVGDESKYAHTLDTQYPLVVEVLPQAHRFIAASAGIIFPAARIILRTGDKKDGPVITENGNYLFDIWFNAWPPLPQVNPTFKNIPGVVETSLFYDLASKAVIAGENGVQVLEAED